jgi:hypothetical protein
MLKLRCIDKFVRVVKFAAKFWCMLLCFFLLLDVKVFPLFPVGQCEAKFDVGWQITLP